MTETVSDEDHEQRPIEKKTQVEKTEDEKTLIGLQKESKRYGCSRQSTT